MPAVSHWQLPVFKELRVEDSFVMAIRESPSEIHFDMEFVLSERHPSYRASEGQPCYRRGRFVFRNVSDVEWSAARKLVPDPDADLGKIDSFIVDGGCYSLRGEWGALTLRAANLDVDVW